jgi:hypothetical protein
VRWGLATRRAHDPRVGKPRQSLSRGQVCCDSAPALDAAAHSCRASSPSLGMHIRPAVASAQAACMSAIRRCSTAHILPFSPWLWGQPHAGLIGELSTPGRIWGTGEYTDNHVFPFVYDPLANASSCGRAGKRLVCPRQQSIEVEQTGGRADVQAYIFLLNRIFRSYRIPHVLFTLLYVPWISNLYPGIFSHFICVFYVF